MRSSFFFPVSGRKQFVAALSAIWIAVLLGSLAWNWYQVDQATTAVAVVDARSSFEKDLVYRRWAASHGGVYVPPTEETPPNPYLAHIPNRDVATTSGKQLTLVNPAYMTRQVHELGKEQYATRGHITSLNPIRPENAPDAWETTALHAFEEGVKEIWAEEMIDGEPYQRYMRALVTEAICLKCHAEQGYKEGDIRGGISVSVPLAPYLAAARKSRLAIVAGHVLLGAIGLASLWAWSASLLRGERLREESEEQYRTILMTAMDGFCVVDLSGRLLHVNEAYCRMTGYSQQELVGMNITELEAVETSAETAEHIQKVVEQGADHFETRQRRKDGGTIDVEISVHYRAVGGGQFVAFVHDISERKRAEEALRESEERYREVVEEAGDLITVVDDVGCFTYVNHASKKIFGVDKEDCVGLLSFDFVYPEDRERTEEWFEKCVRERVEQSTIENRQVNRETGDVTDLLWTSRFHYREDGRPTLVDGIARDITDRKRAEEALRESEETFSSIFNASPMGIYVYELEDDGRLILTEANPAADRLTGVDNSQHIGKTIEEAFPPLAETEIPERYKKAAGEGESWFTEQVNYDHGGISGAFEVSVFQMSPGKAAVLFSNITERKRAEYGLREREMQLRGLSDNLPGGMAYQLDMGEDGETRQFTYVSAGVEELHEIQAEAVLADAQLLYGQIVEADRPRIAKQEAEAMRKMTPFHAEVRMQLPSGTTRWSLLKSAPRRAPDGHLIWDGIELDITDRKRVEDALGKEKDFSTTLVQTSPAFLVAINRDGTTRMMNQAMLSALSYCAEEVVGKDYIGTFVPEEDRAALSRVFSRLIQDDEPSSNENRILTKHGQVLHVEWHGKSVLGKDGNTDFFIGVGIDITERKKADAEREQLREQLAQAQKMESVGRLAGGVAHDFNNKLGVILGYAEMALEQTGLSDPLKTGLEEIRTAAERSADLTGQLLAFARKQTVAPKVLDLNETVEGMLKMLGRLIGENIALSWHPGADLWSVRIDPSQIDQMLANLCVNARDAIASFGKVTIETENKVFDEAYCAKNADVVPGDYVMLAVSDDGAGMDEETTAHLFEPFFTTKEVGEGTGLGLATVYGIVRQNGGFINVHSEPGMGTTFSIYLPKHTTKSEQSPEKGPEPRAVHGQETILVAEDEPALLKLTKMMLERLGYTVLAADSPGEAIRLAREHAGDIHLLISDVVMPEMNGRELAKQVLSFHPYIKRLFVSGYTANVIAHHGVLDEGVHFVQKPLSLESLGAKVREVLKDDV